MIPKSPFFIIENFISPLSCEEIIERGDFEFPNEDQNGNSIKSFIRNRLTEIRLVPLIKEIIPTLEKYYDFEYKGMLPVNVEWYPEKCVPEEIRCENSALSNKWNRINDYDFCGIIFLTDYCDKSDIDPEYEVYGGKVAFPAHDITFSPQRGTLILFPGQQNFTNQTSSPKIGDAFQLRFHIAASKPYIYDMNKFPGDYRTWFKTS